MAKPQAWPYQAEKERTEAASWFEEIARLATEGRGREAQDNPHLMNAILADIRAAALQGEKILREAGKRRD